ncbi:DUF4352 domain-containing protein [Paenalkalicoccus suaedae]|uniref:DUF4352 domain-containing protein n=1 Tax=Paenalkalicoccus suaedae TaxID=2592382 RepID=A0A859FFH2_9BACI|nr:DUF4352 domain-containing protein [Paenalkalicoccus suaedae]QKS71697.1 DUF4352 domain-containing protein [Paenalkalicoccus suaedae]QKS71751.1 DUF4352 domain-containing protein [Paenalkalicoccus suaedae]
MKKLSLGLGAITLATVLVACGESNVSQVETENEVNAAENVNETATNGEVNEEPSNEEEPANEPANEPEEEEVVEETVTVGDTMNFDGLEITLNDAYTSQGGDFEEPSNDHFLVLDMTIANTTDEAANVSTFLQMSVQDDESFTHDPTIMLEAAGSLDGEIGPGRDNRGEVAFDVNASETYEFIFENPFTSGQAIWTIEGVE